MSRRQRQSGFAYIAAVVLLVVVAAVCVALIRLSNTQQTTVNAALLGARASLAARGGIEWGFYQLRNGSCNASTTLTDFVADSSFRVTVRCTASNFNEQGGGGWGWILSDMKSLLETGKVLSAH